MTKLKKISLIILIIVTAAGFFLLISLRSFIGSEFLGVLKEELSKKMSGSQTVGQVTANRNAGKLSIAEVTAPEWNQAALSPVIGQAYKIERLKDDNKPVAVEFTYNPAEIGKGIPESSLRLFKWHSNGKNGFWSFVPSTVNTDQHVVTASLTSFSILAVRAPLIYYFSPEEVGEINNDLQRLTKEVPADTCGIIIIVDEELIEMKDGEKMEDYSRPFSEREESHDCIKNPSNIPPVRHASISKEREQSWNNEQTRYVSYFVNADVLWQRDHEESVEIKGAVVNQKNKPLEGVNLVANKQNYSTAQKKATTDKDGKFELNLHSGEYALKITPGSKNKNCAGTDFTEKFFEFGTLPDDLDNKGQETYRHGPWDKTITLQCSEYYLDETLQLPINSSVSGINVKGTESAHITGQLTQPASGGYGWEGVWEIDHEVKTEIKTSGVMSIMGGTIAMPEGANQTQGLYKYKIRIPLGAKAGDTFAVSGAWVGANYKSSTQTSAGNMNTTANGGQASWDIGSSSTNEQNGKNMPINRAGRVVSVDGENGLTIELISNMANDLPKVKIKHQAE
ncbi:MAG: carboxypeptidase-like regulatory domain-containing protein [Patescibacteria group bacterium]|jgi:hypothetical protein